MNSRFGNILVLATILLTTASLADAQQAAKIPRIGYISGTGNASDQGPYVEALRQGLRDLGYVEGKSDRIPSLVNELVQLKVDLLFLGPQPAIRAAKQATKTIPIVMVTTQNPVAGVRR